MLRLICSGCAIILPLIILPMKIAIASSGLGHVARGIETWALDTADALHRRGVDVTLFAAGKVPCEAPLEIVPCLRRRTPLSNAIVAMMPPFAWRWGLKAGYGIEQLTFWRRLKKRLNAGDYDVLHVQDPMIADLCRKARARGNVRAKEILAHGTEEPLEFLSHFEYLQHLAPWHLHQSLEALGQVTGDGLQVAGDSDASQRSEAEAGFRPLSSDLRPPISGHRPHWTAMPNFVDSEIYCPVEDKGEQRLLRRNLRIPEDAFVIGTAAAIKKHHKRIDYMIREFAAYARVFEQKEAKEAKKGYLVIAGSHQNDTEELQALAEELCPGKVKFLINHPHEQMPNLLRCYDVFVLTSLFEMMPIALLEAIATGLPVLTNNHPVLEWMGGPGGVRPDMGQDGALAKVLADLTPERVATLGQAARDHALRNFSVDAVMQQYVEYYQRILK